MDRAEMCAEVLRRMGIKVGEDDPAFLLVEMNRLELEEAVSAMVERLAPLSSTIEKAGWALAKDVAAAAASMVDVKLAAARETIAKEADSARAAAARAISELAQAQRRTQTDKWLALGFVFGSLLVVCGFAAGYALAPAISTSPKPTTSDVRASAAGLRTGPSGDIAAPAPRTSADRINTVDMRGAESSLAANLRLVAVPLLTSDMRRLLAPSKLELARMSAHGYCPNVCPKPNSLS